MATPTFGPTPDSWPLWLSKHIRTDKKEIDDKWTGGWLLGVGGMGMAARWVAFDDRNVLSENMVVKTLAPNRIVWWSALEWHDEIDATGYRNYAAAIDHQSPNEAVINMRLATRTTNPQPPRDQQPICQYLGHSTVDEQNRRWKLYMEFCQLDTLYELIYDFANTLPTPTRFPEPFIWYVAQELLVAIQVMHQGSATGTAVPGWRAICHRDINPRNVFLSTRSRDRFRYYPKVKLGDFGLACETDENDPNNPIDYWECGTNGFIPPEQRKWYRKGGRRTGNPSMDKPLSHKTNVWGVGMVCWSLMHLDIGGVFLTYEPNDQEPTFTPIPGLAPYSATLTAFVRNCTRFDIGQRFDINQALASIATANPFNRMDTAIPGPHLSRDNNPERLPLLDVNDSYGVRMTREQLLKKLGPVT